MHRFAIVEDSPAERESLQRYIERYAADHGLVAEVDVYEDGDAFLLARKSFDLVFMDIQMPGLDGMECAHLWRAFAPDTPLVFVTNMAQYALHGYEVDAFGFLVKPVSFRAFARVMDKVLRLIDLHDLQSILVPTKNGAHSIRRRALAYVEVFDHDLVYHLADGQDSIRARGSLKQVEQELGQSTFVRVSSSCLVNMDHVTRLEGNELTVSTGEVLYFSRPRRKAATERIVSYLAGDD